MRCKSFLMAVSWWTRSAICSPWRCICNRYKVYKSFAFRRLVAVFRAKMMLL